MWLTSSSVGRKLIMSVTGAFLVLFLTFHALMNGVALFWPTAYNVVCEFLGANWYALIASAVLAAGFILHILYALWLTIQNRRARGSERYAVTSRPPQVEWSSKNMLVLGIVVLAFLVLHLVQFWAKMQLAEICPAVGATTIDINGVETVANPAAGTLFLQLAFSCWITLACYVIGLVALWFHLTHGFWSMFQTCGWNGKTWLPRLKTIGNWWVTIVVGLFLAQAIVFTVQANRGYYTSNECLLEQYAEMDAAHGAAILPCATEAACDQAACPNASCP
ncbi:MAG: hypothetical protein NC210_02015, partial [[Clostridium] fimetarium]|nr:hypothetical protein [[Clostridium] fimetarium]